MALERYTNEELRNKCIEIFYNFMSSNEDFYDRGKTTPCTPEYPTPMDMLYKELLDSIAENTARLKLFDEAIEEHSNDAEVVQVLKEQKQPLLEERTHFNESCMAYMKELYKKTGIVDYSRNIVRIPLDKKINSFYDDLVLEVLFYDDIATAKGHYDEYKQLTTQEERKEFIKNYTEVTHLGLVIMQRGTTEQIGIASLLGELNFDSERVANSNLILLDQRFTDFNTLTLADTMSIQNNDVRQFFQTKIDLDKEEMKVLADLDVRGDNYKIMKPKGSKKDDWGNEQLFIRYICPSTQRVYFNSINHRNLKYSDFYKEGNYKSYIESWWNICHLGADPRSTAEFTRC